MVELKAILTNKMEQKNFFCYHPYDQLSCYLLLVFQSNILFSYNNEEWFPIKKNHIIVYTPDHMQTYKSNDSYFLNSFLELSADTDYFSQFDFPLNNLIAASQENIDEIITLMDGLSFIYNTNYLPEQKLHIPQIMHNLLKTVEAAWKEQAQNGLTIAAVLNTARENMIGEPVQNTVRYMAQQAQYSEAYFCSLYKKMFGISPGQERAHYLVKRIKQYLETTNYSLEKIAELCNLSNAPALIKLFKKQEGLTPLQYKKRSLVPDSNE